MPNTIIGSIRLPRVMARIANTKSSFDTFFPVIRFSSARADSKKPAEMFAVLASAFTLAMPLMARFSIKP